MQMQKRHGLGMVNTLITSLEERKKVGNPAMWDISARAIGVTRDHADFGHLAITK